jgi:RNA polymerase sigma-70 factor (ECF subfamily)
VRIEFERVMLPHLGAAYSLARWLLRHPHDAEDAVQDAMLRAYRAFPGYNGGQSRAWLLAIVRNTCLTAIEQRKAERKVVMLAEAASGPDRLRETVADMMPLPDDTVISQEERRLVLTAIAGLPRPFREVLIMREFHDLSYREIADVVGAPIGTVMSRLSRAREKLAVELSEGNSKPGAKARS